MTEITPQKGKKRKRLLLVEDNPGDIRLTLEAIKECKIEIDMDVVSDGDKVMSFLYKEGEFQNAERPDIIMLDLNLPDGSGLSALRDARARGDRTPVMVLSQPLGDMRIFVSAYHYTMTASQPGAQFELHGSSQAFTGPAAQPGAATPPPPLPSQHRRPCRRAALSRGCQMRT